MPGKRNGAGGGGGGGGGAPSGVPDVGAQELLIMNLTSGGVTLSVGTPQDTLQAWIYTKPLDFDNAEAAKWIDKMIVHLSRRAQQVNMEVQIYAADDEDGEFVRLQAINLSENDPITPDVDAYRFLVFQFIDYGVRERWRLHGFEIFGELFGDEF